VTAPGLDEYVRPALGLFGLGTLLGEPEPQTEAWSNEVVRVATDSGTYVVKLFAADLPAEQLAQLRRGTEVEATVLDTGEVSMPEPVPQPSSGDWLAEVAPAGLDAPARLARVHRWVDGEPASNVEPSVPIVRDVGHSLGVLHALRLPGGDTSALRPVDLDRWHHAVGRARAADAPWAEGLTASSALVEELATRVEQLRAERRPMRISHGDLDPKNAVVRPDGRVALADWDSAGPVLPDVELVVAATSFAGVSPDVDEALLAEFVSAYRAAGGDAGAPDTIALAAECGDVDWLLRNVEGTLREEPGDDDELRQRLAPALVGSFAAQVAAMERWADQIASL
jgi:Ser/Thr protein kinase RdoA (MazF antagonist)